MTASNIQITQGSGTRLATNSYSEGGQTVHDEKFIPGEYPYPTYTAMSLNVSLATADSHLLQLMAGSSLKVRVRRIHIHQRALGGSAVVGAFDVYRVSSAGTGGSSPGAPGSFESSDSASGATQMTLPSSKGTEGAHLMRLTLTIIQSGTQTGSEAWEQHPGEKPIIIPAGTSNGIVIKNVANVATATADVIIEFVETAF